MSFLDMIADPYFKKSSPGKIVFFPWGITGKGYEVTSELQYTTLQSTLKVFSVGVFLIIVVGLQLFYWIYPVILVASIFVLYLVWVSSVTKEMNVSSERPNYYERIKANLKYHDTASLLIGVLFWIMLFIGGGLMVFFEPSKWFAGLVCVVFGGFMAGVWISIMIDRLRSKRH